MPQSPSNADSQRAAKLSGARLVADFQAALSNLATAQTAKYVAEQTERATMQSLTSISPHNNAVYITPQDLNSQLQPKLIRASLDAHLQKAQAAQLSAFADEQLSQTEQTDRQQYLGKRVRIRITDTAFKPVESYWWDKSKGQYQQSLIRTGAIKGSLADLVFRKNLLIIKPSLQSRLFLPQRKFFLVYVINPDSLQPAVEITLL